MRIFVIPSSYPNNINMYLDDFVHEQCKALQEVGHEIVVLDATPFRYTNWFTYDFNKVQKYLIEGIKVHALHYRGLMTTRLPRLAVTCYIKKLRVLYNIAVLEYGRPDLLHAHFSFPSGFGAYVLSKETGVPYIVTEHYSLFLQSKIHPYIHNTLKDVVKNASKFICVSDYLLEAIKHLVKTADRLCVIPNMINDRFTFSSLPTTRPFVFFSAGNLVKEKGFDLLIEAFCKAFTEEDDVCLRIAGAGPEEKYLHQLISSFRRNKQIKLLGRVNHEEMLQEYRGCHCFVLTSKYETFGIVYREAMAVGRPVISSRNGGILYGWDDRFGELLEKNDVDHCGKALRHVYNHIDDFDCELISRKANNNYSKKAFISRINNVIELYSGSKNKKG